MTTGNANGSNNAILVISSHVVRGSVGNRAAVFALETLGHPVWAVPTVILPWHPGHGPARRIVPDAAQFDELVADLERAPWIGEIGGILTGYLGNSDQALAVARLVRTIKAGNPAVKYLCDPVIGDEKGLYVPEATAVAIRDHLMPLADMATPNRFELAWLAGADLPDNRSVMQAALHAGPATMLVTSAHPMIAGGTGNLLVNHTLALLAEHRLVSGPSNGLGDLTSALFLARMLGGSDLEQVLQRTTAAVFEIMARSAKRGADELMLEADASSLASPMAMVQMRRLVHPSKGVRA
ncbi:pyridoxal kinase PdxY [Phyllobacterium sp. 21LDTY02-6]|uniref:pyridoxal kinase PdxY n=1 Tax=unclassified Phyllobacterium TaxID=2638441 RepID=UPI00202000DD|nr:MULTISPECIES: pyridoxal kinase PdxY [unclassified Phyllobacterium]MCO4317447.1 pyridoxal kinase PdxY [Phyllobacterium sp. 21LDTY02-6]MCX8293174.1 pyridoxal kinase PdxY [Phyllobacterium sp. 0TCS1.6A]